MTLKQHANASVMVQEQGDNKRVKASTYFEAAEAQLRAPVKAAPPPSEAAKEVHLNSAGHLEMRFLATVNGFTADINK